MLNSNFILHPPFPHIKYFTELDNYACRGFWESRGHHSTTGDFSSWGSSYWLGCAGIGLQGSMAPAYSFHSCCWRSRSLFYISNLINSMNTSTAAYKKWTLSWFRYNVVFRYLLSVRRVQSELQHCWALQMQRKHLKPNQTDAVKCRLRNHMAFLVDNLQYYLQVTTWIIYFAASQFAYYTHWIYLRYFLHCSSGGCPGVPVFAALTTSTPHETLRAFDWPMTISSAISLHSLSFCSSPWVSIANLSLCQYPRLCLLLVESCSFSGVSLFEWDSGPLSQLLFPGQSESRASGWKRSSPAGYSCEGSFACVNRFQNYSKCKIVFMEAHEGGRGGVMFW